MTSKHLEKKKESYINKGNTKDWGVDVYDLDTQRHDIARDKELLKSYILPKVYNNYPYTYKKETQKVFSMQKVFGHINHQFVDQIEAAMKI